MNLNKASPDPVRECVYELPTEPSLVIKNRGTMRG